MLDPISKLILLSKQLIDSGNLGKKKNPVIASSCFSNSGLDASFMSCMLHQCLRFFLFGVPGWVTPFILLPPTVPGTQATAPQERSPLLQPPPLHPSPQHLLGRRASTLARVLSPSTWSAGGSLVPQLILLISEMHASKDGNKEKKGKEKKKEPLNEVFHCNSQSSSGIKLLTSFKLHGIKDTARVCGVPNAFPKGAIRGPKNCHLSIQSPQWFVSRWCWYVWFSNSLHTLFTLEMNT